VLLASRRLPPELPVGLVAAGVVYFCSQLGILGAGGGHKALFVPLALVAFALARSLDPAWLTCAALVSTLFAAHWSLLGWNSSIGPDRIVLAAALFSVALGLFRARERPPLRLTAIHWLLGATLVYAAISAIAAGTITNHEWLFELLDQYGVVPFLMFLVAPLVFGTQRQRRILLGTLVAIGAYLSLMAVIEKLGITALELPSYISDPTVGIHFGRARGPFVDAGADGLALFGCAAAAAVAFSLWRSRWARTLAAGVSVLCLVGVLLTETRGVWLGAAAGLAVTLVTTRRLWRYIVPAIVASIVVLAAAFAVLPSLDQQVNSRLNDSSSVHERQNTTAAGLRMIEARPLLGFGWGQANTNLVSYFRVDPNIPLTGAEAGLHDIFLQYAVTLGILGFALWLLAAGAAFYGALSGPVPREIEMWQIGLKAFLVATILQGFTAPSDFIFSTMAVWMWAGVLYGPKALGARAAAPVMAAEPQPALGAMT
jgi:O-antigen ligase